MRTPLELCCFAFVCHSERWTNPWKRNRQNLSNCTSQDWKGLVLIITSLVLIITSQTDYLWGESSLFNNKSVAIFNVFILQCCILEDKWNVIEQAFFFGKMILSVFTSLSKASVGSPIQLVFLKCHVSPVKITTNHDTWTTVIQSQANSDTEHNTCVHYMTLACQRHSLAKATYKKAEINNTRNKQTTSDT